MNRKNTDKNCNGKDGADKVAYGTRAEMHEEIMKRKQAERERAKRVRMAKKELYVAPKKTRRSLGLIQIDPTGVLHFEDGRWMKVYKAEGGISHLPELIKKMKGNLTFTHKIEKKKDTYYLTIFQKGDVYEGVRQLYKEDECILSEHIKLQPLTVEELAEEIRQMTGAYERKVRQINEKIEEVFSRDQYKMVQIFCEEAECAEAVISLAKATIH